MDIAFTPGSTTSADGTTVGWEQTGHGPSMVVVHGGFRMGKHYRAFATTLADRFTVHLMDRRGRGGTGPAKADDGIEADVADLQAVMRATGAELVFGHSAGARVALEAARATPMRRLALFEPPLARLIPADWLPEFEETLARGNPARAMVVFLKGLEMTPRWLPIGPMALLLKLLLRGEMGRETIALIGTLPRDTRMVCAAGNEEQRYADVRIPILLLGGDKTPPFLTQSLTALTEILPDARRTILPGVGHNGPDQDNPQAVATQVAEFFSTP